MNRCADCKHWGAEPGEVAGLCLVPVPLVIAPDGNLPAGITLHREMMGPACGASCGWFSAKQPQTGETK